MQHAAGNTGYTASSAPCRVKQWAPTNRSWINVGRQPVDTRYVDQVKAAHSQAAGLVVCYRVRGRQVGVFSRLHVQAACGRLHVA